MPTDRKKRLYIPSPENQNEEKLDERHVGQRRIPLLHNKREGKGRETTRQRSRTNHHKGRRRNRETTNLQVQSTVDRSERRSSYPRSIRDRQNNKRYSGYRLNVHREYV